MGMTRESLNWRRNSRRPGTRLRPPIPPMTRWPRNLPLVIQTLRRPRREPTPASRRFSSSRRSRELSLTISSPWRLRRRRPTRGRSPTRSRSTVAILGLRLLEVGLAVVISNSVFVGEWLRGELLLDVWGWFVISWGWGIGNWDLVGSDDGEEGSGSENLYKCDLIV